MKLLVLGDLHLGEDEFSGHPHPSWDRFDAIVTVGDVAHSRVAVTDGNLRREELIGFKAAREFFQQLDELDVPVVTVPGNHDYSHHTRLINGTAQVQNLHQATSELDGNHVFGFGSEKLDDGPEVRYDPETVTKLDDFDTWLEQALDGAFHNETTVDVDELRDQIDEFDQQFVTYTDQYETLTSIAPESENGTETIGVAHVPPFNTTLDRVAESVPRIGGRHWGSIALKNFLTHHDISFLACGHIHEDEGVATVAGTPCLNAGYRSAHEVTLETSTVSITDAELPVE